MHSDLDPGVILDTQAEFHDEENDHLTRLNSAKINDDTVSIEQFNIDENGSDNEFYDSETKKIIFEGHTVILESKNVFKNKKLRLQIAASMISLLLIGLTDQTIGSLIEYFLKFYEINRVKLSYLFIAQICGYIPASFLNNYLMTKIGLYHMYWTACAVSILVSFIYFLKMPYPMLIFASVGFGWTNGSLDCCMNYFVGSLDNSNELLGLMHSFYGVGCLITPSLSIYLIHSGMSWNKYYIVLSGVGLVNFLLALLFFKNETSFKYRYHLKVANEESDKDNSDINLDHEPLSIVTSEPSILETIKNKYIVFYSLCLFLYVGSELSCGIWLNNYMYRVKHLTEDKASLIVSTFWFWVTIGRFFMGLFTGRYFDNNETRAIVIYCWLVALGCLGFWVFEESLVMQTICVSMTGWFVGPIFGTTIIIAIKTLPQRYSVSGISLVAGIGGTGAAVIPSIMGYIAEHGSDTPGDGAGLAYFPETQCITFTMCALVWLIFYIVNKTTFDSKLRLK